MWLKCAHLHLLAPTVAYYEVRDTCRIALELISYAKENPDQKDANGPHPVYQSVDPAPPEDETRYAKYNVNQDSSPQQICRRIEREASRSQSVNF